MTGKSRFDFTTEDAINGISGALTNAQRAVLRFPLGKALKWFLIALGIALSLSITLFALRVLSIRSDGSLDVALGEAFGAFGASILVLAGVIALLVARRERVSAWWRRGFH
jgi:hypothetical protein